MGQKPSSDGFNFAHTSFMLTEPKSWRKVTIAIIAILAIVIILLLILVICLVVLKPWEKGNVQRDEQGNIQAAKVWGCFPADATVITSKGPKTMDQLKIGDMITDMDEQGQHTYTKMYAWFRKSNQSAWFVELTTDKGPKLVLSLNHLIVRRSNDNSVSSHNEIVLAKEIRLGDSIYVNEIMNVSKVISIRALITHGLYAPATISGTLFVDGIFVSAYTDYWLNGLAGHEFIHKIGVWPLRMISSIFADNELVLQPMKNENLWFVEVWKALNFVLSAFSL